MSSYFDFVDHRALLADYPVAEFRNAYRGISRDALVAMQNERFTALMQFAWKVPFYHRRWSAAGIEPGDIRSLEDLPKLPAYSKSDLMASVESHPPLGDFHGLDAWPCDRRPPLVFHTTSGTTGTPQPLMWGPKSREVQNMLLARLYSLQGMTAEDVVHSVYGFGLVNGGHYIREAVQHWVGAQMLPAGTGAETRSAQQVQIMKDFGATVLVGFGDYVRRLAEVARDKGLEPGRDIPIRMVAGHFGSDGANAIADAWGIDRIFDWYGVGDTGAIAGQGPDRDGMHLLEDAHVIEVVDPDTMAPVADGKTGEMVCTCLYKDDIFPVIRFQTHDLTEILPGANSLGLPFRRIAGHQGRSDSMVKLKGINVYPHGIGAVLSAGFGIGEYVCRAHTVAGQTEMTVLVESADDQTTLAERMEHRLKERLGVAISVQLVAPGATAELTELEARQKPRRLIVEASE